MKNLFQDTATPFTINRMDGPIKKAESSNEFFLSIAEGSVCGGVYLMFALIELACEFATDLRASHVLTEEIRLLNRRSPAMQALVGFDLSNP